MPSYDGLYGIPGLFCQYKVYPEFENTKILLSFYNGLAHVFKTDVDRYGFQRTTSYEDVDYNVNKASRLHLIVYFERAVSYKPFDLVISDYTESEDYSQGSNEGGLIAGITTICIVFVALRIVLDNSSFCNDLKSLGI